MGVSIEGPRILFQIPLFGGLNVTETVVNSWLILIAVFLLCKFLTHNLEKIPHKKRQQLAEKLVVMIDGLVRDTMGSRNMAYVPYIMTLMVYSLIGSLISLLGFRSVTADLNVTLTWGVITFILIWRAGFKANGPSQLKGLIEPIPLMLPMNLIGEIATPVSMAFRHFGNVLAGYIISTLVYVALSATTQALFHIAFPLLAVGLPAVLSVYFDLFSGVMQAFIFAMLSMVYISNANAPAED